MPISSFLGFGSVLFWFGFGSGLAIHIYSFSPEFTPLILRSEKTLAPSPLSQTLVLFLVIWGRTWRIFVEIFTLQQRGTTLSQIQKLFITPEASNISPNLVPFFLNVFKWFYWDLFGLKRILSTKIGFLLHVTWRCAFSV